MDPREPAGGERGEGKSAELSIRARTEGGAVGNTCGTVCGTYTTGALSAYRNDTPEGVNVLSVGACLYRLFLLKPEKNKKYGGHQYEVRTFAGFHCRHDYPVP